MRSPRRGFRTRFSRQRAFYPRARRAHSHGARGHSVPRSKLRSGPLPEASGDIWLGVRRHKEELRFNIGTGDNINEAKLAELDEAFRCPATGVVRAVEPRLYEILSLINDHYPNRRVELVSGFRYQHNEGSRHYHASAMDIRVPGVPARELAEFVGTLDTGGMGIGVYPRSRFVHVDFRAPGEPSYRWVDMSRPGSGAKGGSVSRRFQSARER